MRIFVRDLKAIIEHVDKCSYPDNAMIVVHPTRDGVGWWVAEVDETFIVDGRICS